MQATLKDIIRTNRDRLFIVDPECYIIFTGDSLEDTLPFIRVGNWINMPVELIPLIENIIITDSILGNPSHEQFNIDVRYLETNKYIGSENIVKRYLDFQNIFGLDLQNASIVNIEKDIPELSAQKNISKNHFMGVFYRDGNFKTVYHGKDIIDVKDIETKDLNLTTIQKKISAQSRKTERYAGAGIVILKHNPIFYNNNFFTSYLFPPTYFEDFSRLSINPEKIREILFPSSNLINLSRFLKWKNNTEGKVTIFSDHDEQLAKVKKLFSKSRIKLEEFDGLGHNTGDGLYIKNYKNTFNIKLVYESVGPAFRPLTISFIKSATGTKQIVKDDLDAIFITYSAYEDTNLFFKATKTPAAIIYDGNRNISRLEGSDTVILYPRIQYNFERHDRIETIYNSLDINEDILSILVNEDISRVETIPTEIILALEAEESSTADSSTRSELEKNIAIYNIASLVRVFIYTISNRKFSAKLKNIYLQLNKMIKTKELFSDISKIAVTLIFYNESIFQFISLREKSTKAQFLDEIPLLPEDEYFTRQDLPGVAPHDLDYYNKIREDRIRLIKLLNLFVNGPAFSGERKNEMTLLKQAIEERKKLYADDFYVNTAVDLEEKQGLAAITDSIKKLFSKDPHRAVPGEEVYVPGEEPGTMADHELKSGVGLSDMNAILNKNQGEDGPGAAEKLPGESDKEYALRLRKDVEKLTGTGGALEKLSGESDSEHAARLRDYIKELASSHEVPEQRSGETDREYTERLRDHVQELVRTRKTPEKILGENDNEYASRLYDYIDKLSGGAGLLKKMPGESYNEYVYRLRMYVEELTAPDGVLEKLAGEKDTDYAKRLRRYAEKLAGTGEALKKLPGEKNTDYAKRLRMFIEELTGVNGVLDPEHNETDTQYAERLLGYLEELTDS
ncbi:MAG: hypothetical protein GY754_22260, partial [bacterium]|nr:hypothetical protein [bacterium]